MQLTEIKVSKNVGVLYKTSSNVKLISCLRLHGKKINAQCAKIILFLQKKVDARKGILFLFCQTAVEALFYEGI